MMERAKVGPLALVSQWNDDRRSSKRVLTRRGESSYECELQGDCDADELEEQARGLQDDIPR